MRRRVLLVMSLLMTIGLSVSAVEDWDSINVNTGEVYYANTENDTVDCDELCEPKSDIPQIPLCECDSAIGWRDNDRYIAVYKDGKWGVYDWLKGENVTRIEFERLGYAFRRQVETEFFSYFYVELPDSEGTLGVTESNNHYMLITMPKEK